MKIFLSLAMALILASCSSDNGGGTTPPVDTPKKECALPWGGLIKHGESTLAFEKASVPAGELCKSEARTCNDGSLSGSHAEKACVVLVDEEPATHEKPARINDKGLKVGAVKEVGKVSTWHGFEYSAMATPKPNLNDIATCAAGIVAGGTCTQEHAYCKIGTKVHECRTETTYKVFGWVYEEVGRDYKAVEGVKADIFWFVGGCMGNGMCDPMVGPVKTDKYGYFELLTTSLLDQVRLDGTEVGLYAFCSRGKPIPGGGATIQGMAGKAFSDAFAHQKRIKPDSCKDQIIVASKSKAGKDDKPFNANDVFNTMK